MNTQLITNIAKELGISSTKTIAIMTIIWLVFTSTDAGGRALWIRIHDHTIQPTPMDIALNDKGDIRVMVSGLESQMKAHIAKLDLIKMDHEDDQIGFQVAFEKWKAAKEELQRILDSWRSRASETETRIGLLISGTV